MRAIILSMTAALLGTAMNLAPQRALGAVPVQPSPLSGSSAAASAAAPDTVRVLLSFADRLQIPWARATILRSGGEDGGDMIIVTHETTPADLEKAVRMLFASHESVGEFVEREIRAHVSPTQREPTQDSLLHVLGGYLAEVEEGTAREVRDFGLLPSVVMLLPQPEGTEP